jgi:hypothetical protein
MDLNLVSEKKKVTNGKKLNASTLWFNHITDFTSDRSSHFSFKVSNHKSMKRHL